MRSIFDQYDLPEKRLTHALAVCLNEDRGLLKNFLRWLGDPPPGPARSLFIKEQSLPGDPPESDIEAERKGLPDIVIHDGLSWSLVIESKVQATLTADQLYRHERTLRRRGFTAIHLLALTKGTVSSRATFAKTWAEVYRWLGRAPQRGEWAERLRVYLRAAEVRLAREGYLDEGTLTMFDGFPFSDNNPYTYGEAKRLLRLALKELRHDRRLRQLGIDARADGRPAITGRSASVVWDFLPLAKRPRGAFTQYPHLTLAIHSDHLEVSLTIPDAVGSDIRRRLRSLGPERLVAINAEILRNAKPLLKRGAQIRAYALQRHYTSQRSPAISDAMISFRLETSQEKQIDGVKRQPEWMMAFAELARRKRSNIQFQYRVEFRWGETPGLDSRDALKLIADSWIALNPLLRALASDPSA